MYRGRKTIVICKKCGKPIEADVKYCHYCGEEVDFELKKKESKSIIPGFRTNKKWKKILAILGYICFALVFWAVMIPYDYGNDRDRIIQSVSGATLMILLLVVPFLLITNFMGIRHKLPLFKKRKISSTILASFLVYILIAFGIYGVDSFANSLYSEEYFNDKIVAEKEQEAKAKAEAEKEAKEKAEAEKKAREKAEAEKKAKEKAEAEKKAKEKAEAEKKAKEKAEAEKKAKEKAEAEKVAKEKEEVEEANKKKEEEDKADKEEFTIEDYVANCTYVELEALARNPGKYVGEHIIVEGALDVMTIFDFKTIFVGAWTAYSLEVEYDGMGYDQNFNEIGNILSGDYGYVAGEFIGDETIKAEIVIIK